MHGVHAEPDQLERIWGMQKYVGDAEKQRALWKHTTETEFRTTTAGVQALHLVSFSFDEFLVVFASTLPRSS